jgi:hypothetical protein
MAISAKALRRHVRERWRAYSSLLAMAVLTEALYFRPGLWSGKQCLVGADYQLLHMARLTFAREALFGPRHTLPAWYPLELMGAPFAANIQSFPWIPTRFVLFLFDPEIAYAPAVALAALLAAVFTYLYCRRAGLSEIAAAASGWTFACAGYFATRIIAGHLPLLEAYPSLPLLLWLADRALDPRRAASHRFDTGCLAGGATCVVLAGHPQIPAYAVGATLLYVIWLGRGWLRARLAGALVLGSAMALAVWWPMLLLIRKSTRVLDLDAPDNDIVLPYRRVLALFSPGIDGWPGAVNAAAHHSFSGYPNLAYFYDTASYIGLAPMIAVAALFLLCCVRKRLPSVRWLFLASIGLVALIAALPLMDFLRGLLPGLIFRSPARLLYITGFSLAAGLGAGVDAVLAFRGGDKLAYAVVAAALGLHGLDLGGFSRRFVSTFPRASGSREAEIQRLGKVIKDGRVAVDFARWRSQRRFDDIGSFDSLLLVKPYRAILGLAGAPPRINLQVLDGITLGRRALEAAGVVLVFTPQFRPDLILLGRSSDLNMYLVQDPVPRAGFYGTQSVAFLTEDETVAWLRSSAYTKGLLLLPPDSRSAAPIARGATPVAASERDGSVVYRRPSSDEIELEVSAAGPGFVDVLESYDPGWSAQVDGQPAPIFPANSFTLAAPVQAGKHAVRLRYHTPGRRLGIALSLSAAGLLALLLWRSPPARYPVPPERPAAADPRRPRRPHRRRS